MRMLISLLSALGIVLLLHPPAGGQVQMPASVVGNGGCPMTGPNHVISGCTVGQSVTGFMSGPGNIHQIGFWHPAEKLTPAEEENLVRPQYWLGPNYPNPFNPVTTLQFAVPSRSHVTIRVYDVNGRLARTVVDEELDPGWYTRVFDAEGLASGVYFYRMTAGRFVETRKLVLLK